MPRTRKTDPKVVIPTTSLVASAVRYPGKAARIYQPNQNWQHDCYRHYAICGEARFAARFFGHALSRAVLSVGDVVDGERIDISTGPARAALDALFNGKDGQAQMLNSIGLHLTIAGECYLVGRHTDEGDVWEIISCMEMKVAGNRWTISYGDGLPDVPLTEEDVVIRIWQPNPARRIEADSPFRSLLPILTEIEWLTKHIFAQVQSRLVGAGILFLPSEMTFPPPPEVNGKPAVYANQADGFMMTLASGMMETLDDPGLPSANVPIVVTTAGEDIDKPRLMHFWSELDSHALELRSEAIRRFALGMDLPPEQVLGMSSNGGTGGGTSNGVSHWGAWQIEESTIKMHIEPMLETVDNALTIGYLRPTLGDNSLTRVFSSTAALRLRPDRSQEAMELYDRGLLSATAVLRENGFDEKDRPDDAEFEIWLLRKVASGSATPEQVGAALKVLGVDLGVEEQAETTRESRPDPTLDDHPSRPRTPSESALTAACDALVFRALERAGNRLRNSGTKPPGVPSYETHVYVKANGQTPNLLEDAWSCAPQVLAGIADPEKVIPVLDSYLSALFLEQSPHTRDRLAEWLKLVEA